MPYKSLSDVCGMDNLIKNKILSSDELILKTVKDDKEEILVTVLSKDKMLEVFMAVSLIVGTEYALKIVEE